MSDSNLWGELGNIRYMGPYALAGSLREAGISTTIIDFFTRIPDFFRYIEDFLTEETLVVGISSTFLAPASFSYSKLKQRSDGPALFYSGDLWFDHGHELDTWLSKLKELMKVKSPRAKLVLGGAKSQYALFKEGPYKNFDYIVLGPADRTLVRLVETIEFDQQPLVKTIRTANVLDNSIDVNNKFCPPSILIKEDSIPMGEAMPIEISRGCVFNCKFCHYDKKESFKKDLSVLKAELIHNYENFNTQFYSFCDDCFNDHPRKVEEVCNLFLSLPFKIEWAAYARVDVAVKFPHTADLMVEAGARGLYWGLESFNHVVARNAGKGTPTDKVQAFLVDFHSKYKNICLMEGSFVTGLPGETDQSLQELEEWLLKNPVLHLVTVGALNLMPYNASLDKAVIDYAEYSRDPKKYGFEEIRFAPPYWRHQTMDLPKAKDWAERIGSSYRKVRSRGIFKSIWAYPHVRGLGFSQEDSIRLICDEGLNNTQIHQDVIRRVQSRWVQYWQNLKLNSLHVNGTNGSSLLGNIRKVANSK